MWKKTPEDLLGLKHMELLPLLPLTQGGNEREVVELMFAHLAGEQFRQLATMGFLFAALAFHRSKRYSDQEWLESRYNYMHDILQESPAYQWILNEGRAEGIQAMQQAAIRMVIVHFADLEELARAKITALDDLARLQQLILDLNSSHSLEEVEKILRSL